jgi:hypothetical protein
VAIDAIDHRHGGAHQPGQRPGIEARLARRSLSGDRLVLDGPGGSRMRCAARDGFLVAARALWLGLPRQVARLVPARRQLAHVQRAVLRVAAAATTRVPGYDVRTRIAPVAVIHRHGVLDYASFLALLQHGASRPGVIAMQVTARPTLGRVLPVRLVTARSRSPRQQGRESSPWSRSAPWLRAQGARHSGRRSRPESRPPPASERGEYGPPPARLRSRSAAPHARSHRASLWRYLGDVTSHAALLSMMALLSGPVGVL